MCFFGQGCSSEALVGAARNGHLAVVKLLRELRPEQFACHGLKARAVAAAAGHGAVSRWLDENDPDLLRALQEAVVSSSESSIGSGDGVISSSSESSSNGSSSDGDGDDNSRSVQQAGGFEEEEDGSLSEEKGRNAIVARPDESECSSGGDDDSSSNYQQAECDDEDDDDDDSSFFSACSSTSDNNPVDIDSYCCSRDPKDGVVTRRVADGDDGDERGWANDGLALADLAHGCCRHNSEGFDGRG